MIKEHTSISSDDTSFDFNIMFNRTIKQLNLDKTTYLARIRQHFHDEWPDLEPEELGAMVAIFLTKELDFKHFCEVMDALGAKVTIKIETPDIGASPIPSREQEAIDRFYGKHITNMGLTVRLANVLEHSGGISTFGDLAATTAKKVAKIKGMGPVLIEELEKAMKEHGIVYGIYQKDDRIDPIQLSIRAFAVLKNEGFTHWGQLTKVSNNNLRRRPGMTGKTMNEIRKAMEVRGLMFADE